jgi:hypothetical protein
MQPESALARLHAKFFGPDDCHARDHLFERGFYLDCNARWHTPHGFKIMPRDYRALAFLAIESGFDPNVIEDPERNPFRSSLH